MEQRYPGLLANRCSPFGSLSPFLVDFRAGWMVRGVHVGMFAPDDFPCTQLYGL